jgi:hypothetical protein
LKEGRQAITDFVDHYNAVRLHSGICYVTPLCKLEGKEQEHRLVCSVNPRPV